MLLTQPRREYLAPRFLHSADVRRFCGPLTGEEALLLERLEQQRHSSNRVRAYIADPDQKFARVLALYLQWTQLYILPDSSCLIDAPKLPTKHGTPRSPSAVTFCDARSQTWEATISERGHNPRTPKLPPQDLSPFLQIPDVHFAGGRNPWFAHSHKCVHQALIIDADRICPSLPYHSSRLDTMHTHLFGTLPLRRSVFIFCGDPYRRRRNSYRRLWNQLRERIDSGLETPWQLLDLSDPASALAPKVIRPPAASINYVPDPECEPSFAIETSPSSETPPSGGLEAYA